MFATTDYAGIATLIVAIGTAAAAIVGAILTVRVNGKVSTAHGTPDLGDLASNTAAAVTTPPGRATIGQAISDGVEVLDHVHDIVCDGK